MTQAVTYPIILPDGSRGSMTTQASTADIAAAVNQSTIQANVITHIGQLESWLTANPNGAVLNAAQTKFVAQTLIGVGRLLLGLTSTVGGAT